MSKRPNNITDEHLECLDELKYLNDINMFVAPSYLEEEFGVNRMEAKEIVQYWMKSFSKTDR